MASKKTTKFIIQKIEHPRGVHVESELVRRLLDLGFHPGLEVEVVNRVSFNSIAVVRYGSTTIALNREEFSCLHGH